MSNLFLNLDELSVHHERVEENRIKIFDGILSKCHDKIKKYNREFKKQECLYSPPTFILGKPPYNYVDLVNYLITSLRKNGLRVDWLSDRQAIYISWKKNDIDIDKYHNQFTKLTYVDTNQQDDKPFSVMSIRKVEPQTSSKRKKKNEKPSVQHMAYLEYKPGVKDFVPISFNDP